MADEYRITNGLQIGNNYRGTGPQAFTLDQQGTFRGPFPGAVRVSTSGYDVDLSGFTQPGIMEVWNQEADTSDNWVEYGIFEPDTGYFYALGEVGPGERYTLKLSREVTQQRNTTGTGGANNTLRFRAGTATSSVFIGIFQA